jgi:hypothetical protein
MAAGWRTGKGRVEGVGDGGGGWMEVDGGVVRESEFHPSFVMEGRGVFGGWRAAGSWRFAVQWPSGNDAFGSGGGDVLIAESYGLLQWVACGQANNTKRDRGTQSRSIQWELSMAERVMNGPVAHGEPDCIIGLGS